MDGETEGPRGSDVDHIVSDFGLTANNHDPA